jgi:hypothetical protein
MFRPYLAIIRLTGYQYQLRYKCSLYLWDLIGLHYLCIHLNLVIWISDNHIKLFYLEVSEYSPRPLFLNFE